MDMEKTYDEEKKNVGVRLPGAMYQYIKNDAVKNHRSVSSQITALLEEHLKDKLQ